MNSDTGRREKFRAVFLAAIMALSMVAMGAAGFAGSAVAQEPGDDEAILLDTDGDQVDSYDTIQAAVNGAAEENDADTVLVGSGMPC